MCRTITDAWQQGVANEPGRSFAPAGFFSCSAARVGALEKASGYDTVMPFGGITVESASNRLAAGLGTCENSAMRSLRSWLVVAALLVGHSGRAAGPDFSRDVRPILSNRCFKCHGPDDAHREAGLRLDVRDAALAELDSGTRPIVPGHPDDSELIARITSTDPDLVMPPPHTKVTLTENERRILTEWIAAGAEYRLHWAFVKPQRPAVPHDEHDVWSRNDIDRFVAARLRREEIVPSPEADRATLCRRVHLDLVGLPPTPAELDAFLADEAPGSYERLVDRLLASPRYGERWARRWLDLARYADTNGYEKDRDRSIWPWRDWVIQALNDDMPFDRFTICQIAGDLLPGATPDDIVATGFHRNTMINEEGGIDPLEFRYLAMVDRVGTTGATWLGLTTACAQCHTHKFDPLTHTDYFALMALLDNADEPEWTIPSADRDRRQADTRRRIEEAWAALPAALTDREQRFSAWDQEESSRATAWHVARPVTVASSLPHVVVRDDGSLLAGGDVAKSTVYDVALPPAATETRGHTAAEEAVLAKPDAARSAAERTLIEQRFLASVPELSKPVQEIRRLEDALREGTKTLVLRERPADNRRVTRRRHRGEYTQPEEEVAAATPAFLPSLPTTVPADRLALANWLVSPDNPLTPRVTVNRHWQAFFGRGIVATLEDFGHQGDPPSHPELLDWLAGAFRDDLGWSTKKLHRLIVTSATYRQASSVVPTLAARDPANVLLARGPRVRLDAEVIRDSMLAAAGILSPKMGGPGVRPPQPEGITEVTFGGPKWPASTGEDRHRRSIYTYQKRTAPFAMSVTFDGPSGEACVVRRDVSNSALQALTLLNDPMFMEAARALGAAVMQAGSGDDVRLTDLGRRLLARPFDPIEHAALAEYLATQRQRIAAGELDAARLAGGPGPDAAEQAAWMLVARAAMNLDEAIVKR